MIVNDPATFSSDVFANNFYRAIVSSLNIPGAGFITVSPYCYSGSFAASGGSPYTIDVGNPSIGNVATPGAYTQRSLCFGNLYIGTSVDSFTVAGIFSILNYMYWPNTFQYVKYINETAVRYMAGPEISLLAVPVQLIKAQVGGTFGVSVNVLFSGVKISW